LSKTYWKGKAHSIIGRQVQRFFQDCRSRVRNPSYEAGNRSVSRDEDRKLTRVGTLAREKPIFLLTETLEHRIARTPRRSRIRSAREEAWQRSCRGRKGEHPGELKTRRGVGSSRRPNGRRPDERTPDELESLKATTRPSQEGNAASGTPARGNPPAKPGGTGTPRGGPGRSGGETSEGETPRALPA
jgi:hypothetical protein